MQDELTATVRADFDRLAAFDEAGWSHNNHYHGYLLHQLPAYVDRGLDVGCGTGDVRTAAGRPGRQRPGTRLLRRDDRPGAGALSQS